MISVSDTSSKLLSMDKLKGILDRLPASVRHSLIAFAASLLAWAGTAVLDIQIQGNTILTGVVVSAASTIVTQITLWFTPISEQYGVGSKE